MTREPEWAKHYQHVWLERTRNRNLPNWLRVAFLAFGSHKANGHAAFAPGDIGAMLGRVDRTTGELIVEALLALHVDEHQRPHEGGLLGAGEVDDLGPERLGATYGLLTVVADAEPRRKPSGRLVKRVAVSCACGSDERVVDVENLVRGNSTSCGCTRKAPRPDRRKAVVSYAGMHSRLDRQRGKARDHECIDCADGTPADEWAYDRTGVDEVTGTQGGAPVVYSLDVDAYSPRCRHP